MNFTSSALLAACLAAMPGAVGFAKDTLPFAILSTSIDSPAKQRALPDFSLIERSGRKITLADLRGKVWIADFIYTRCPDTCPMQTADMAKLQDRWIKEDDVRLVTFSVDPERDTPTVLSEYAKRFKADSNRWLFLTGTKREITHLIEDGFHLLASSAPHGKHGMILHSSRFVLIDWQGQVRGHYDNRDPKAMGRLEDDVTRLLKHEQLARDLPNAGVLTSGSGVSR